MSILTKTQINFRGLTPNTAEICPLRTLVNSSLKIALLIGIITLACSTRLQAQADLQEIVRFDLPGNVSWASIADTGGDINGDGRPDLVFGYWGDDDPNTAIHIYHSIPDSNAVPDQILPVPAYMGGGFGRSIAYAGDLNGDGIDDLVVGIKYYGLIHQGAIAIYWGGETLSEQPDVFIDGEPFGDTQSWDLYFGQNLITHCDVNGDGINDLLVYAEGPQWEQWGNVYVFLGGMPFSTTPALQIRGSQIYEHLGWQMESGDINADGYDDIILCSSRFIDSGTNQELDFELKIYAGGINLSNIPVYDAHVASTASGSGIIKVIANGDLNGDGFDDIVIHHSSAEMQRLKVLYGQGEWNALISYEADFQLSDGFSLRSYCDLTDDQYSDLLFWSLYIPVTSDNYECMCILEQTGPTLDLSLDYCMSDYSETNGYFQCYEVGDLNQDGFNEFVVWAFTYPGYDVPSYVKILTESYTSIEDDLIPAADLRLDCYPNPFKDALTISVRQKGCREKINTIKIYDLKGRLVFRASIPGSDSYLWDGKDSSGRPVSSGIYFLQAKDIDNKIYPAKIVRIK